MENAIKSVWARGGCLGLLVALTGLTPSAAGTSWSGTRNVDINDPQYQMKAYTVAVPSGWKFAGEVVHDTGCHGRGAGLKSLVQSPDGASAIGYFPGFRWDWTTNVFMREAMARSNCPGIEIDSAAGFLINIAVPHLHPFATIVSVQPLPPAGQASLAAQLTQARQSAESAAARYHVKPPKLTLDGARVRIRYEEHGKITEEQVQSVVDCNESQMPAMIGQAAYSRRNCAARNFYVVRAPQGHLDELLASAGLDTLSKATQINPDWLKRVTDDQMAQFKQWQARNSEAFQGILRQGQESHDALMRRGEAFQRQEREQFEHSQAADHATVGAMDQAAHRQVLDSLGRQEFTNPSTGQVIQANAYYDHQWMSSDGSTLIQTNGGFDPNGTVYPVSQSWTELVPR